MSYLRRRRHKVYRMQFLIICIILWVFGFMCGYAYAGERTPENVIEAEDPSETIHIHSETTEQIEPTEPELTENLYDCVAMNMTSEEFRILEQIVALEAQDEPYEGQKAVVEVILNRVLSPEFPDSVYGVLSQKNQFTSWKYLDNPYNTPGQSEKNAIDEVIRKGNKNTVLPEDYVFFSTEKVNGTDFIKIGNHQFSRAKKR